MKWEAIIIAIISASFFAHADQRIEKELLFVTLFSFGLNGVMAKNAITNNL